jgi:hypothetical protein
MRKPAPGSGFWRYYMPAEAARVVDEALGFS